MDAPPTQYARTEDGVNIAYWTRGKSVGSNWAASAWAVNYGHDPM
jgi:hypothetical protein